MKFRTVFLLLATTVFFAGCFDDNSTGPGGNIILSGEINGADSVTVTLTGDATETQVVRRGFSYSFVVPSGGTYVVTSSKPGYTCSPSSKTFAELAESSVQDFTFSSGTFVFSGDGQLYMVSGDGSDLTQLTNNSFQNEHPAWSPDGAKIAFDSNRDGNRDIYCLGTFGVETRVTVHPGVDVYPSWFPWGNMVTLCSYRNGDAEICWADITGTQLDRVSDNPASDISPSCAPTGWTIAFASDRSGTFGIYVMTAVGTAVTQLTNDSDDLPAWSPDGTKIAFTSLRDGNREIYVMNADGSAPTRLTSNSSEDSCPVWSPDGVRIAFSSNRSGAQEIYIMNADGTGAVRVTNGGYTSIAGLSWKW